MVHAAGIALCPTLLVARPAAPCSPRPWPWPAPAGRKALPPNTGRKALAALEVPGPLPVGTSAMTGQTDDPQFADLLRTHFSQITPEWEMKMESILGPDEGWTSPGPTRLPPWRRTTACACTATP